MKLNFRYRHLRYDINCHIRRYKVFYILLLAVFLGGVLWGIFGGGANEWLFVESSLEYFLRLFNRNFSFFSHLFSRLLSNLLFVLIICALSIHIFCLPFQLLYIVYRGYIFGIALKTIVSLFSLTGIINIIFILVPMQIVIMFLLFFCCIIGGSRSYYCYSRRDYHYLWHSLPELGILLLKVAAVCLFICIIECLLIILVAFPLNRVFL